MKSPGTLKAGWRDFRLRLFGVQQEEHAKHDEQQGPDFMEGLSPAPLNLGKSLGQRDSAARNRKAPVFFLNMLHEGHMIRTVHASLMVVKQ